MTTVDILISCALILLVLRQVRGRKLTVLSLIWPILLVIWAALEYVTGFPSQNNGWLLMTGCIITGLSLGVACGVTTAVYVHNHQVYARAGIWAVFFWIVGMSGRLIFGLYAEHGGAEQIYRFSLKHNIPIDAWATALVMMALCEVTSRTIILAWKLVRTRRITSVPTTLS